MFNLYINMFIEFTKKAIIQFKNLPSLIRIFLTIISLTTITYIIYEFTPLIDTVNSIIQNKNEDELSLNDNVLEIPLDDFPFEEFGEKIHSRSNYQNKLNSLFILFGIFTGIFFLVRFSKIICNILRKKSEKYHQEKQDRAEKLYTLFQHDKAFIFANYTSLERGRKQVNFISASAYANLIIGVILALSGLIFLGFTLLDIGKQENNKTIIEQEYEALQVKEKAILENINKYNKEKISDFQKIYNVVNRCIDSYRKLPSKNNSSNVRKFISPFISDTLEDFGICTRYLKNIAIKNKTLELILNKDEIEKIKNIPLNYDLNYNKTEEYSKYNKEEHLYISILMEKIHTKILFLKEKYLYEYNENIYGQGKILEKIFQNKMNLLKSKMNNESEIKSFRFFLTKYEQLISQIFPKLGLVILVELLAFFFLKIYRSLLDKREYLNNEITNIEMKTLALLTADDSTRKELVKELIKTERNPIFEKQKTSALLENERIRSEERKSFINRFSNIWNRNKG